MRDENGYYVVDDLRLTEDQYKANFGTEEEMRQAMPHDYQLWLKKVVSFCLYFKARCQSTATIFFEVSLYTFTIS